jgi:hypothetical protein
MRPEWDDERLREAFRALSESETSGELEVDAEKVWQAVAGELGAEERREILDKVALEPGYAEAWRLAAELFEASGGARATDAKPASAPAWRPWELLRSPYGLAAAAMLLVGLLGVLVSRAPAPREPIYRGDVILPLAGADETLPRDDFRLRWEGPPATRYAIRVTTEDLQVMATASDLSSPEYLVPAERLSELPSGSKVFWQVEARLGDGSVVQSGTFIAEVR